MNVDRRWQLPFALTLVVAVVMTALVVCHVPGVNGPDYWFWPWRWLPPLRWYGPMLLAGAPMFAAWFMPDLARRWSPIVAIALIMTSVVAMKLTSVYVLTDPPGLEYLADLIRSPDATSYYVDAARMNAVDADVLDAYPELLRHGRLNLHTLSKPPGPVMYHLGFIRALGDGQHTAMLAGVGLAVLASLAVPAAYWLARRLFDHRTSLIAAMLLGVCPGFVVVYPTMDATYVAIACATIGTWHATMQTRSVRWAVAFGLTLALACFASYSLLTLGALLAAWTFAQPLVAKSTSIEPRTAHVAKLILAALATMVGVYVVLAIATGFDPIATFRAAWGNQQVLLAEHGHQRPWRRTVLWDLLDFFLSFGWAMLVPIAFGLRRAWNDPPLRWFLLVCVLQPVVVALTGLLQAETARVWNFMLPLVVLPAAFEIVHWPKWARIVGLEAMFVVLLTIGHGMTFMHP